MLSGTAAGELLPSYVVYKSMNPWNTWTIGEPSVTSYYCSKSGSVRQWVRVLFEDEVFLGSLKESS